VFALEVVLLLVLAVVVPFESCEADVLDGVVAEVFAASLAL